MKILLSFIFISFYAISAYAKDDIWNKSIEISEKNRNYKAKNIELFIDEINKDGTVSSSQEIYQKLKFGKEIRYDTTKILKNGKDITKEAVKKRKGNKSFSEFLNENDIFSSQNQDKITINKSGTESINSFNCNVYEYKFNKNSIEKYQGKAWINKENASPVKIEYTMNPLPIVMKNLSVKYIYENKNEKTYLKTIIAEGEVSLVIYKKIFRIKANLKDYINL